MNDNPLEPKFYFTDTTINEADQHYAEACELMKDEPHPWCLRTHLTLVHPMMLNTCEVELELYENGDVRIIDFRASVTDPLLNFDLRILRAWAADKGWNVPVPSKYVVYSSLPFWKHMWQVYAVNSPELDASYGTRPEIELREVSAKRDDGQPETT